MGADIARFYSALQPGEVLTLEITSAAQKIVCKFRTDGVVSSPRLGDNEPASASTEHDSHRMGLCLCWLELGELREIELDVAESFGKSCIIC